MESLKRSLASLRKRYNLFKYNLYNSPTVTCKCINGIPHEDFRISLPKDMPFTRDFISKVSNMEDPLFIIAVGMMLLTVTICTTTFNSSSANGLLTQRPRGRVE